MRVAFLGKGGSGKTTVSAGFTRYASKLHDFVLAIDADVNVHLHQALGLTVEREISSIKESHDEIQKYLRGTRSDLGDRPMISTTPPTFDSNFVRISPHDEFLKRYATIDGNIGLLTVGSYEEDDIGASCFHEMLYTLAGIMHHTLDSESDCVVADTTAGTDNVATSLWFAYDLNVFVVEPTEKSIGVYKDFIELHEAHDDLTLVVANKIEDSYDEEFIREHVSPEKLIGILPYSDAMRRFEQGEKSVLDEFETQQSIVFQSIYDALRARKRNWRSYLEQLRASHERLCKRWYNNFYSLELHTDLDENFDYEVALSKSPSEPLRRQVKNKSLEEDQLSLVIFDCDGVLVETERFYVELLLEFGKEYGFEMELADAMNLFAGVTLKTCMKKIEETTGKNLKPDFFETFRDTFADRIECEIKPVEGIRHAIESIHIEKCVVSNSSMASIEQMLGAVDLLKYFKGRIFSGYDLKKWKPDPALFLHAAASMNVDPKKCLIVEDSLVGVQAAQSAGMKVLAYTGSEFAARQLKDSKANFFDNMVDLPEILSELLGVPHSEMRLEAQMS